MEYKDELSIRLQQYGIEPNEDIIRFIDLETISLKSECFEYLRLLQKVQISLRNGGYGDNTEYGKLYASITETLNKYNGKG